MIFFLKHIVDKIQIWGISFIFYTDFRKSREDFSDINVLCLGLFSEAHVNSLNFISKLGQSINFFVN